LETWAKYKNTEYPYKCKASAHRSDQAPSLKFWVLDRGFGTIAGTHIKVDEKKRKKKEEESSF